MSDKASTEDKRIDVLVELFDGLLLVAGFVFIGMVDWKLAVGAFIISGQLNSRLAKIQKKLGI